MSMWAFVGMCPCGLLSMWAIICVGIFRVSIYDSGHSSVRIYRVCICHRTGYFCPSQKSGLLHMRVWTAPVWRCSCNSSSYLFSLGSNTALSWDRCWVTYTADEMSLDNPSVHNQCAEYFSEVTVTTNRSATWCFRRIAVMMCPRVNVNQISSWTLPLLCDHCWMDRQDTREKKSFYTKFFVVLKILLYNMKLLVISYYLVRSAYSTIF
jgi:hypothetical protein